MMPFSLPDKTTGDYMRRRYWQQLDALNVAYEAMRIETSFGDAQAIFSGPEAGKPLVLLHAENSCAPAALTALAGLLDTFRVYAIDIIGQSCMSAAYRPNLYDNSYGQWMHEILTRLRLRQALLVGFSFGAFIAWKSLTFNLKPFKAAVLIAPLGVVQKKRQGWWPRGSWLRQRARLKMLGFTEGGHIPLISPRQAQAISIPVSIVMVKEDPLLPAPDVLHRWKKIFPAADQQMLLAGNSHIPDFDACQLILPLIRRSANEACH